MTTAEDRKTIHDKMPKPPLKWAGGKRWLLPHLRPIWRDHTKRRLVEPFCGGLAVSLGLAPEEAYLNDINIHAINFYQWLKKGLKVTIPMANDETLYYEHRDRFNQLIASESWESAEGAQLFYYLNRTGYNGLCRFNKKGFFNVPFGKYRVINYKKDFSSFTHVFKDWIFMARDFEGVHLFDDDFIYADPPYDVEFTKYSKEDFDWEDQVRLAEWLAVHPGPVLLSNQATPRILELYKEYGFQLLFLEGPRRISCDGDRTPAREVLAKKNL